MSVVDNRVKYWTVSVGGLDCTPIARTLQLRFDQLSPGGVVACTGMLSLGAYADGFAESTNPRLNPSRWAMGQPVVVTVLFEGLPAIPLPIKLSITKRPAAPYPKQPTLEIPVGCDFALLNYRQPEGDQSGVQVGVSTQADDVIDALLEAAGLPPLMDLVPEYPLDYPLKKLDTQSYTTQAGAMAFARCRYLWQQTNGDIRAPQISFDLASLATYTVGTNEADYFPVDNDEAPPEELVVTCVAQEVKPNSDPPPVQDLGDGESSVTTVSGLGTGLVVQQTRVRAEAWMVLNTTLTNKIRAATHTTKHIFDSRGRLATIDAGVQRPKGAILPNYYTTYTSGQYAITESSTITRFSYDPETDLIFRRYTTIREPKGKVEPSKATKATAGDTTLAESIMETWVPRGGGKYRYYKKVRNYREDATSGTDTISDPNSDGPPATEYRQPSYLITDKEVKGRAEFPPLADSTYRPSPEPLVLPAGTAISDEQCNAVAECWGRIRQGRAFGISWAAELTPLWLENFAPLRRVDFIHDGTRTAYLTDGLTLVFDETSASIGGDGIEIGLVGNVADPPSPPFRPKRGLVGGFRFGGVVTTPDPEAREMAGGTRFGGTITLS